MVAPGNFVSFGCRYAVAKHFRVYLSEVMKVYPQIILR